MLQPGSASREPAKKDWQHLAAKLLPIASCVIFLFWIVVASGQSDNVLPFTAIFALLLAIYFRVDRLGPSY